jgi:hypothetical protein
MYTRTTYDCYVGGSKGLYSKSSVTALMGGDMVRQNWKQVGGKRSVASRSAASMLPLDSKLTTREFVVSIVMPSPRSRYKHSSTVSEPVPRLR